MNRRVWVPIIAGLTGALLAVAWKTKANRGAVTKITQRKKATMKQENKDFSIREKDDDRIERAFIEDYVLFGSQINFRSIITLLEKARLTENHLERKSLCVSGLQLMFSSWEDYSVLLHAVRNRKEHERRLHSTFGADDDAKEGSTYVPKIYKGHQTARQTLDNFGFPSIKPDYLRRYELEISEEQIDDSLRDLAVSIRQLGAFQSEYNDTKNRLKHGKGVLGNHVDANKRDRFSSLSWKWNNEPKEWELQVRHDLANLPQLEMALSHVAKLFIRSLDLLMFYMIQYHPHYAKDFPELVHREARINIERVRSLGINSKGLTDIL